MRPQDRVVLFLQGPPTPFWAELGDAVAARGATVLRVNLHLGDALFWRRPGAVGYRGRLSGWRRWLDAFVARHGVTDVLYFADRLPYHRIALKVARAHGAQAHAVEFGYLRPDWLTLEREGGGAFSHFPTDPARLTQAGPLPDARARFTHPFRQEALCEVAYNLCIAAGRPLYPFYFSDKYYAPLFDYLCWLRKLLRRAPGAGVEAAAAAGRWPFALAALQLQSDYQLRASAAYPHQADMLREVIASFAAHAAADMRLVVKLHPLDNGYENWPRVCARLAAAHGVAGRVLPLDGGNLAALIAASRGVVTINSTVGIHALRQHAPVIALGAAVYDMAGLTHQRGLDAFWTAPDRPDPALVDRFVATMAAQIQFKGSFYHPEGRRVAAAAMAERIVAGRVGPPGVALPATPPRIGAVRAARRGRRAATGARGPLPI